MCEKDGLVAREEPIYYFVNVVSPAGGRSLPHGGGRQDVNHGGCSFFLGDRAAAHSHMGDCGGCLCQFLRVGFACRCSGPPPRGPLLIANGCALSGDRPGRTDRERHRSSGRPAGPRDHEGHSSWTVLGPRSTAIANKVFVRIHHVPRLSVPKRCRGASRERGTPSSPVSLADVI